MQRERGGRSWQRWLLTGGRDELPVEAPALLEDPHPGRLGICCSGGGIRSAAFNLGALQVLSRTGVMGRAAYLSAVSGGSYIAAALCMVAKTPPRDASEPPEGFDDSDPRLVTSSSMPFHRGSPEEQYLRNHASYLAPDGSAKLFLGFRILMGLTFNVVFVGLLALAAGIALGLWLYGPAFGDLDGTSCPGRQVDCFSARVPVGAQLALAAVGGLLLLVGAAVLLLRPRRDELRQALETWAVRLLLLEVLLAILLVAVPVLVDAVRELGRAGGTATATQTASSPEVPAVGAGGLASLLAAVLLQLRAKPAAAVKGAAGWWRKAARGVRLAFVYLVAAVVGPLLLLGILVLGAVLALAHTGPSGTAPGVYVTLVGALGLFGLIYALADLNTWSLHPFYRRRLCSAFALKRVEGRRDDKGNPVPVACERDFRRLVPLSRSGVHPGPSETTWPTLIVCAAANVSDPGVTPPGRGVTSFTFTPESIGGPLVGFCRTKDYEARLGRNRQRDITLPAAVAVSGAALSPAMGKLTRKPLVFLMALANVRLGVWIPNPARVEEQWRQRTVGAGAGPGAGRWRLGWAAPKGIEDDGEPTGPRDIAKRPRPSYLFREMLGRNRVGARFLYVTDGGHYENLGLVELLRRGCTTVYCFDAGGGDGVDALGDAIALARSELQVEIAIDTAPLVAKGTPALAGRSSVTGTIDYGPGRPSGRLVYVRSVMTAEAPPDVHAFREADPAFPHHSTADQFFTDQKFEAYRALGERAAADALEAERAAASSEQESQRLLESLTHRGQEPGGVRPVEDPVVAAEAQRE